jgi:TRAP-type C4-dicarboxylate transport system permease small subunit
MRRRFPQRQYTHSIVLHPRRRTRRSTNVIVVIVILVQSIALAALGWDASAIVSIIGTTAALFGSTRVFCPLHD